MRPNHGVLSGSPLPPRPRPFNRALRFLFVRRPPQACAYGFILPRAFRLLQSSTTNDLLPASQKTLRPSDRPESASLGVPSLIAASTSGVHHSPGIPSRTSFRPRRFSRPRRLAPPPAFAGLFHPAATSRVCPSGVCPSPRSRTGFPRPSSCPLAVEHTRL